MCVQQGIDDWITSQPLEIEAGKAVAVSLPFEFTFYRVKYDVLWVAAAGFVSFEEQHSGTFADVGSVHSAVVVVVESSS